MADRQNATKGSLFVIARVAFESAFQSAAAIYIARWI
jgi:hypothetical protein